MTLFQITLHSGNNIEVIRYALYVIAQLVHLFVFCWEGQRLIDHSLQIRDKIYNCSWYEIPVKSRKLMLHVITKSLQSNTLSASRIFIFSLQGFTTVLQTSMSYFTVLSSVQ
ncbi:odorant receptor 22c-like [Harpegnathos saltator]|uniref:odorant receptor 22c-like n=1 Tax=Harpegnathos saltator TaxID=610380 RepID=UPI000DBEE1EA|nr:odorant receptor 22c-like [Harpegnathos saltator]